jgi:hypothetical protein
MSVQSVSAIGHLGASKVRSRRDNPEVMSWGYVQVVHARQRRKAARLRRAGKSSKVGECPGNRDMSVEDQGVAGLGSGVRECVATAWTMPETCWGGCKLYRGL